MSIFLQRYRRGFLEVELSIESLRLAETLSPSDMFLYPSGDVGALVNSLQFSYWMLRDCIFGNPAS